MRYRMLIAIGCIWAITLIGGCSSGAGTTVVDEVVEVESGEVVQVESQSLGWPPPAAPAREVSASICQVAGADFTLASGVFKTIVNDLELSGEYELPWAIYSLGDLSEENELAAVRSAFSETPLAAGDGTRLYFAIANFQRNCWEWIGQPTPGEPWAPPHYLAPNYRSAEGEAHVAVVLYGPGKGLISSVTFTSSGDFNYVSTPQNLTAVCEVAQQVQLDWDAVDDAEGYNVYRSTNASFDGRQKINSEPVTENTYTDVTDTKGEYYFYQVTAVGDNESDPSKGARVWCFGIDLAEPTNLLVTARAAESFTVAWDWGDAGDNPPAFTLFIDTTPYFTLQSDTMRQFTVFGSQRQNTFHDIEPGVVYYWKLCASAGYNGPYGRMSSEMLGTSKGFWQWDEVDVIGQGTGPARIVDGDGMLGVSYFQGSNVNFAYEDGEDWVVKTPFEVTDEEFMENQDLTFGGGSFCLAALAIFPGDSWSATWMMYGEPGDWETYRVHGDGVAAFNSPKSGYFVTAAASDTEFSILHYFLTDAALLLHSRPIEGGEWTTEVIRDDFIPGCTPSFSACYLEDDLYVLSTHNYIDELLIGNRDDDWSWQEIRSADTPKLAYCHDLHRFQDEWWTPALQSREKDLHLLHGDGPPWEDEVLNYWFDEAGYYTRMAVEEDEAILITYAHERYSYAIYSENWKLGPIDVPGISDYGFYGDVVYRDGCPYVIFEDNDTGNMMVVKGTPPED